MRCDGPRHHSQPVLWAKTDEADIVDIIGLRNEYSFAEMTYAARELGYKAVPISASFEILTHLKIPVILFVNNFGVGHFTVLKGVDGHECLAWRSRLGQCSSCQVNADNCRMKVRPI